MRSLRLRLCWPGRLRSEFYAGVPGQISVWMVPAFFLGLAPPVLRIHFGINGGLITGFVVLGPFAAALAGFLFARRSARWSSLVGLLLVAVGKAIVLTVAAALWLSVVWLGAVVGGFGFGGAIGGGVRLLAPRAQPRERSASSLGSTRWRTCHSASP